jgi:membrane-associated phospholipid phosphatase
MRHQKYWQRQLLEIARDCSAFGSFLFVVLACLVAALTDRTLAVRLALGLACVEVCGNLIKFFFYRDRPNAQPHGMILEKLDAASFPSIHTARCAMVGAVMAASAGGIILWATVTVLVGGSRILLKKHYFGDVLAGAILGLAAGWLMMEI